MSARPAIRIDKGVVLPSGAEPLAALSKPSALVTSSGGQSITTSLMVAEKFGKAHKNVLRAIDKLECSPEFRRLNFAPAEYVDDQGKPRPMFSITRDGFSLLAMGFTGREAMQWKERYIAAFSAMDLELRRIATNKASIEWQEARAIGKADHTELTDAVKALCERAHARGDSATPQHLWHISAAKTITRALFVIEFGEKVAGVRDRLTRRQLLRLLMPSWCMPTPSPRCLPLTCITARSTSLRNRPSKIKSGRAADSRCPASIGAAPYCSRLSWGRCNERERHSSRPRSPAPAQRAHPAALPLAD